MRPERPGVHVEEGTGALRPIRGVPTSVTAFIGAARFGPTDRPGQVRSFAEFERVYGGLSPRSPMSYAVRHYFLNGGQDALICRITGTGGASIENRHICDPSLAAGRQGLWMLEHSDLFNLLCIPPLRADLDVSRETWDAAAAYARSRQAMLIVDPPATWGKAGLVSPVLQELISPAEHLINAALYLPRIRAADPLRGDRPATFAASGAVAGVFARTDSRRGVWKAPAGMEANLAAVSGLVVTISDGDNDQLNRQGVNSLRSFPGAGPVVWGARTLGGSDAAASEWKYVPVRRTALHIEQSIYRGTRWSIFEPNDEPLWTGIRLQVEAFLQDLFRRGAFPAATPSNAYFVKCGTDTITQNDQSAGVLNILVGFAPLRPAEFVVVPIRQSAGPIGGG